MVKPKGDKQVEYLDLDLDSGKSTPPRKKKSSGSGSSVADERVDYVVVDQQKTLALKSTREAWTDGRQSTESETPTKSVKWKYYLFFKEQKGMNFEELQNHSGSVVRLYGTWFTGVWIGSWPNRMEAKGHFEYIKGILRS